MPRALALLIGTCFAFAAWAEPVEWAVADGGNGHYYEAIYWPLSWEGARDEATSMEWAEVNGYLATITSAEENQFVLDALGGCPAFWLGAYQTPGGQEPDGGWTWISGEAWGWTNWHEWEPNDDGDEKYLMTIWWDLSNQWNDEESNPYDLQGFLVEFDPDQTATHPASFGTVKALYR